MKTLYARPTQEWPVLGMQGQKLGTIVRFALDPGTGKVKYLELRTSWQTIDIQWPNLEFDENQQSFKLNKQGRTVGRGSQAAGDLSGSADSNS